MRFQVGGDGCANFGLKGLCERSYLKLLYILFLHSVSGGRQVVDSTEFPKL